MIQFIVSSCATQIFYTGGQEQLSYSCKQSLKRATVELEQSCRKVSMLTLLEYSELHEQYILAIKWNFSSKSFFRTGSYKCAHSHPVLGELEWCEINYGLDWIAASSIVERIKIGDLTLDSLSKVSNSWANAWWFRWHADPWCLITPAWPE